MARAGRAEWAKRVQRWADSGLTAKEYAAETGLNPSTLAHWRWRLGAETTLPPPRVLAAPVKFVELEAEQVPAPAPAFFEVALAGGRTIRVPPSFDGGALVRLLAALEGGQA